MRVLRVLLTILLSCVDVRLKFIRTIHLASEVARSQLGIGVARVVIVLFSSVRHVRIGIFRYRSYIQGHITIIATPSKFCSIPFSVLLLLMARVYIKLTNIDWFYSGRT